LLVSGNIIALPTETVYGLSCDINNGTAVQKIFELKGRDYSMPLSAFCNSIEQVESITDSIPEIFYNIFEKFLPGPLAVVINKHPKISDLLTSGKSTIAIRIPDNAFVLELLKIHGKPLASTSANISSHPSSIDSKQVFDIFNGKIPIIFDGNQCKFGIESTILDISNSEIRILREGVLKIGEIEDKLKIKVKA
jgi:L-threonylcarbamoyladenylate synthase